MIDIDKWADFILKFGAVVGTVIGLLKRGAGWFEKRDKTQADKYEAFVTKNFESFKEESDRATKEQFDNVNKNIEGVKMDVEGVKQDVKALSAQVKKIDNDVTPIKESTREMLIHLGFDKGEPKMREQFKKFDKKMMGIDE
mgnify:FL=1